VRERGEGGRTGKEVMEGPKGGRNEGTAREREGGERVEIDNEEMDGDGKGDPSPTCATHPGGNAKGTVHCVCPVVVLA